MLNDEGLGDATSSRMDIAIRNCVIGCKTLHDRLKPCVLLLQEGEKQLQESHVWREMAAQPGVTNHQMLSIARSVSHSEELRRKAIEKAKESLSGLRVAFSKLNSALGSCYDACIAESRNVVFEVEEVFRLFLIQCSPMLDASDDEMMFELSDEKGASLLSFVSELNDRIQQLSRKMYS